MRQTIAAQISGALQDEQVLVVGAALGSVCH